MNNFRENSIGGIPVDDMKKQDIEQIEQEIPQTEDEKAAFAAEEKALVRKIDLFLLPTIWLMYLLSYMDRYLPLPSILAIIFLTLSHQDQYRECTYRRNGGRP